MPNLDSQPPQQSSDDAVISVAQEEEVHLRSSTGVQPSGSPSSLSARRRASSARLGSMVPVVLIHGWLLSFSHYVALYSMLIARLGTRCDCRKLRAKSEVVRRRSVNYAKKCQESLLPIVDSVGVSLLGLPSQGSTEGPRYNHRGSRRSNLEDYYQLFFLHCTSLEFFMGQMLRTVQLFQSFSLNVGRSLTSSLVAPPANFIYSGLAVVERPPKKRSQLLQRRDFDDQNTYVNDSVSGIELELASRTSCGQTPSGDHENHSSDLSQPQPTISSTRDSCSSVKFRSFFTPHTPRSPSKADLPKPLPEGKKKFNTPVLLSQCEHRKKVAESDNECFEKLIEDIRIIQEMIADIHTNVPLNPWGKSSRRAHTWDIEHDNQGSDESDREELDESDWPECYHGDDLESGECTLYQEHEIHRLALYPPRHSHFCFSNSAFYRWKRSLRNTRLMRAYQQKSRRGLNSPNGFEEKSQEDDETVLSKRLRRNQYICLSLIIVIAIGLFGSALGSCIYFLT